MHILLLSAGGGGGNIVRSVKATFRRDVAVTQKTDPKYAERLRRAVTTRFLDTNEFALSDVPKDERVIIGARTTGRLGARHDPGVALQALHESRASVEALISRHSIVILVGTGGKGTGSGTMFPLAQMAREQRKLVIPIFVRPSFERHEVDKRHYDNAVSAVEQFDAAGIRLIEILNDRGYAEHDPQPQPVVWERMNLPIARGLRGLIYVLWDLSQVDPSDLSMLFAGHGRLRIGYGEIDPPAGGEPSDAQVEGAARQCCDNPYYAFRQPAGTSLICIQGDWSNLVDAKIKGEIAAGMGADASSPYSPLYARAVGLPRPWGVTALFSEYTGVHQPLDVNWSLERGGRTPLPALRSVVEPRTIENTTPVPSVAMPEPEFASEFEPEVEPEVEHEPAPFATFWEFAVALNHSSPAALALAGNGASAHVPIDPLELRRLLGTLWFRSVLTRLSGHWRDRMLETLIASVAVADHTVKSGRKTVRLRELSIGQLQEIRAKTMLPDDVQADVDLLITVGRFWGPDAVQRVHFVAAPERSGPSMLASLLDRFRSLTAREPVPPAFAHHRVEGAMNIRSSSVATVLLLLLLHSQVATGQTRETARDAFDRFSLHMGGGALLNGGGHTVSAAFGFSPLPGLDLVVSVERDQLPFRRNTFSDGFSVTRGGTLTLVSGEVRASLFPPDRVSPYVLAGIGAGVSRPTVNDVFPDPVVNDLRAGYFGGGVRVPLRNGLSVFGDARAMLAVEGGDGIMGVWPVRAGVTWRF